MPIYILKLKDKLFFQIHSKEKLLQSFCVQYIIYWCWQLTVQPVAVAALLKQPSSLFLNVSNSDFVGAKA